MIGTSPCKKRRERTRAKVSIAAEVFNGLGTATHVVESAKSDIVIFMGQTMWSLGLGHQRMHDGEETSRHIPSSLINAVSYPPTSIEEALQSQQLSACDGNRIK